MTRTGGGLGQQAGRTVVVTGANSGIGAAVARALVERGAHVVLAVRDTARVEQAAAHLPGPDATSVVQLDLADLDQVAHAAEVLMDRHEHLSGLVCNAGVMGGPMLLSAQGFELQMATNHLGHAALGAALWPLLHDSYAYGVGPVLESSVCRVRLLGLPSESPTAERHLERERRRHLGQAGALQ